MEGWWALSYAVLWLLVISLSAVVVALARQIGTLHLRLGPRGALEMDDEGPVLGEHLPPIEASDLNHQRVVVGGGEPQLLLFVSPGCQMCEQVLPGVAPIASSGRLQPYVITDLDRHETRRAYTNRSVGAPVVAGAEIAQRLAIPGTPYLVVTDRTGVVRAKGTINNLEQMEGLVDTAMQRLDAKVS